MLATRKRCIKMFKHNLCYQHVMQTNGLLSKGCICACILSINVLISKYCCWKGLQMSWLCNLVSCIRLITTLLLPRYISAALINRSAL